MKQTIMTCLRESGNLLLKNFGHDMGFKVKESQSSIVTSADFKSDDLIVEIISKKYPSHNIISEESGFLDYSSEFTWVIDPLDGTSNFASSLPWFGVLITLFKKNVPLMGGAYLPVQNILYFAEKHKGATMNDKPLIMKRQTELKNALFAFSVDFTDDEELLLKCINIYKNIVKESRSIRSTNSLIDFLNVAEGKFGGCINLFTRIWDISGLGLIISEAGGVIKDINGHDLQFILDAGSGEKNYAVMAGSKEIIDEVKEKVLIEKQSVKR